jgi:hypothetical protein
LWIEAQKYSDKLKKQRAGVETTMTVAGATEFERCIRYVYSQIMAIVIPKKVDT